MAVATINVQLDDDTARIYTAASTEDQKKLQMLLSLWSREFIMSPTPLTVLMDEISERAEARGLTAEVLESLLYAD